MARFTRSVKGALGSVARAMRSASSRAGTAISSAAGPTTVPGPDMDASAGGGSGRRGYDTVAGSLSDAGGDGDGARGTGADDPAGFRATGRAGRDDDGAAVGARGDDVVPWSVRALAAWSWRLIAIAAALAILVWVAVQLKVVVVALLVSILLAVLLTPISAFLRRIGLPRSVAALGAMIVLVGFVTGLLVLAGQSIASGFQRLADQALEGFDQMVTWLGTGPLGLDQQALDNAMERAGETIQQNSETLATGVLNVTSSVAEILAGFFIAIFCTFFFLSDGRTIWHWLVRLAPASTRTTVHEAGIRAWYTVTGYTRGQIIVAFIDAVGIGAAAALLQVPLALPIAILVFLGAFIPIIGALVSGAVAALVAFVDSGIYIALAMLGAVLLVQFIESHILQPMIQSRAVKVHPIAVLLAVAGGTAVASLVGALFAVPIVAVINSVGLYLAGRDPQPHLATSYARPGGPPGALHVLAPTADEVVEVPFTDDFDEMEAEEERARQARAAAVRAKGAPTGGARPGASAPGAGGSSGGEPGTATTDPES
jgi:predicted PurR-regulated permease PerM